MSKSPQLSEGYLLNSMEPYVLNHSLTPIQFETTQFNITSTPSFKYQGLGVALVKSLRSLDSYGLSIKMPITAHFPQYDQTQYLPRFGSSLSINHPLDYKCTFTASVPILALFYGMASLSKKIHVNRKSYKSYADMSKHSSDPNRRIGVALSFGFNLKRGFRMTYGPWAQQFSNDYIMDILLPYIILLPSLFLAFLTTLHNTIYNWSTSTIHTNHSDTIILNYTVCKSISENLTPDDAINKKNTTVTVNTWYDINGTNIATAMSTEITEDSKSIKIKSKTSKSKKASINKLHKNKKNKKSKINLPKTNNFNQHVDTWKLIIMKWLLTKSPGIGYSTGLFFTTGEKPSIGSSAIFDMSGFYPMKKQLKWLYDSIHSISSHISSTYNNSIHNIQSSVSNVFSYTGRLKSRHRHLCQNMNSIYNNTTDITLTNEFPQQLYEYYKARNQSVYFIHNYTAYRIKKKTYTRPKWYHRQDYRPRISSYQNPLLAEESSRNVPKALKIKSTTLNSSSLSTANITATSVTIDTNRALSMIRLILKLHINQTYVVDDDIHMHSDTPIIMVTEDIIDTTNSNSTTTATPTTTISDGSTQSDDEKVMEEEEDEEVVLTAHIPVILSSNNIHTSTLTRSKNYHI